MNIQPALSKVVLSLDDDVEVCALLEHVLWPHRVIGVAHAYVALELLAREAFDLFILDLRLPDMDGLELCRRIRMEDPNAPIVFCSGSDSEDDRLATLRAGASGYYLKPFDPELFQAGIEELLQEAEDRNRLAEAAVRQLLGEAAGEAVGGEGRGVEVLQDAAWQRFVQAGGTRSHFVRAWPAMMTWSAVSAPVLQPDGPIIRNPGA